MRLFIPQSVSPQTQQRLWAFHATYFTGRTLATVGNGTNRTDWDFLGGQLNISGNTIANSLILIYWNLNPEASGLGFNLWDREVLGITTRIMQTRLDNQGCLWMGLGDMRGSTFSDRRTNSAAKRVLWALEYDGAIRTCYFIACNSFVVSSVQVLEPALLDRITVTYRPTANLAQLWYNDILMSEINIDISGLSTSVWLANVVGGLGVHKTPVGAATNRLASSATGMLSPDP